MLGYVSLGIDKIAEPDDFNSGDILDNAFDGVTLTNEITGGSVYAATAGFGAPTGTLVFAPGPTSASGWSSSDVLRADFDRLTATVSIDVGSDDSSDVAYLRAWDAAGNLLEEVISNPVSMGNSETISITRGNADIAYITAAGTGGDITPLDRLFYGSPGSDDIYGINAGVGEALTFEGVLPGAGPYLFDNGLDTPNGSDLRMELYDPNGNLVASDAQRIMHTTQFAGYYQLRVFPASSAGEYFIQMDPQVPVAIDTGMIVNLTSRWKTITFGQEFVDPIVFVGPATINGPDPAIVRVRNVTSSGFQAQIKEWNYLNGHHTGEDVSFFAVERGTTVLDDGTVIVAGSVDVKHNWETIDFGGTFGSTPVVIASMASRNGSDVVTPRIRNTSTTGFDLRLQEEEANNDLHVFETVNFLAIEAGLGSSNGLTFESGFVTANSDTTAISYSQTFEGIPSFFASIQTFDDSDPAAVRLQASQTTGAQVFIEEESSMDSERMHGFENLGYLVIERIASESPLAGKGGGSEDFAPLRGLENELVGSSRYLIDAELKPLNDHLPIQASPEIETPLRLERAKTLGGGVSDSIPSRESDVASLDWLFDSFIQEDDSVTQQDPAIQVESFHRVVDGREI